jgi:thioredoxin reductase
METRDLTIIGGGPTGLAAAFRAGMHEISARIIDTASQLGGQLSALYPEKKIYDVFGLPEVTGRELVDNLAQQALQFGADTRLGETVKDLRFGDAGEVTAVVTEQHTYPTRALVIAGGLGLITPRKHSAHGCDRFEGKGVYYSVTDPQHFRGKEVVTVGGGDSALDWALNLVPVASRVTVVHRSEEFAGHASTLRQLLELAQHGRVALHTSTVLGAVHGNGRLDSVTLKKLQGEEHTVEAQALLPMIGFQINLGPMERWGLELQDKKIVVNSRMETNLPGIFAAGDIASYPGKIKLIATGFAEAAIAVKSAVEYIRPGEKVRVQYSSIAGLPKAKPESYSRSELAQPAIGTSLSLDTTHGSRVHRVFVIVGGDKGWPRSARQVRRVVGRLGLHPTRRWVTTIRIMSRRRPTYSAHFVSCRRKGSNQSKRRPQLPANLPPPPGLWSGLIG